LSIAESRPVQFWLTKIWSGRWMQAAASMVNRNGEGALFGAALATFVVVWMIYDTVSNASIDIHFDLSEASVWAETFAFGYKHPPMTAWIFRAWFSVFPRADWAAYLLAVTSTAITFAVIWRLLRDYLDKERALIGIAALFLVPLYTFQASHFNANTVTMPFWAAAILFYLRARRNLGMSDAALAGAFAAFAFLGKYWSIYLIAGMVIASVIGSGTRRFWRCPAPYVMAATAAIVVAPHIFWFLTERSHAAQEFLSGSVMTADNFSARLVRSALYLGGAVSYIAIPILFLIGLRPNRAALADILWPSDADRQQAGLLLAVPLLLPALANLVFPHRLTALWTFPNWALLPVVLYGSPLLVIPRLAVARSGIVALAVSLTAVIVSPYVAYARLRPGKTVNNWHYRYVAAEIRRLAGGPIGLVTGDWLVRGLPFYLPTARPVMATALSESEIKREGIAVVCVVGSMECRWINSTWGNAASRSADVTFKHRFLGFEGKPISYNVTVIPPDNGGR
jgi:4-amino-4-deoxy-L-arabinose transferase-like glycosyltransferase